jgi:hypothetical protein
MNKRFTQRKSKGQTIVILAGALLGLLALVALAIDGGSAYAQRRIAQNASDGAAMAGITQLKDVFLSNRVENAQVCGGPGVCARNISSNQNQLVKQAIENTLRANGIRDKEGQPGVLDYAAYWLKSDGTRYGTNQIGAFESLPFATDTNPNGVAGVWVEATRYEDTTFARIVGWNKVSADAKAGARLGSASAYVGNQSESSSGPLLWPITLMQEDINLAPGQSTTIFSHNNSYAPGNWGLLCFTGGACNAQELRDQFVHGFNPSTGGLQYGSTPGSYQSHNSIPLTGNGIWLDGQTGVGSIQSWCDEMEAAGDAHRIVAFPITAPDPATGQASTGNGTNASYHIITIATFELQPTTSCSPASSAHIDGRFIGYGWDASTVTWTTGLGGATSTGQVVTQFGP